MRGNRIRVLLLEDDPLDAELVKRAIHDADMQMELHSVTRVAEATEALASQHFELVLSDLSLPDSDGSETIARLRQAAAEVPIVVLTSVDDRDLDVELLDVGAQDYIPKDRVTGDILGRAIRHAIQRQEQLVETQRLLCEVKDARDLLESKNSKLEKLYNQAHEFVDNVSHEFRTPLTVIKEYASLVCDGLAGEVTEEQTRMLNIVEDRADDLNTMVDDMLDSSKLGSGLLGAWRKPCNVSEILRHVKSTLSRKARVKGVQLLYELDPDLPELYCDAEKVGRVITNLAVNAIKFCGDPGTVRIMVSTTLDNPDVIFKVEDNGPGIDESSLQQIFERFQQLGTTSRGSCKGFGLGLAIAKELVDLNFGRMTVESEVGKGSAFQFSVPKNDPLELMERYLLQVDHETECPPIVSLVVARIDSTASDITDDGIDGFLNYLLRRNDLLLQGADGEWFLALPTDKQEVQKYFQRSQQAWEDANRNRPFGPLPRVDYQWLGSWRIPEDNGLILNEMAKHVIHQEVACV
ncbi:MAG: response regulator [Planctomycetes bacterium]|nr:response regulator [Planctomycetota bacterium]